MTFYISDSEFSDDLDLCTVKSLRIPDSLACARESGHEINSGGRLDWRLVQVCTLASRSPLRLAHHTQLFANLFILQCLGVHVSRTVPGLLVLFLVVEQPLLHPKHTTIQHTQLFPPPILLHSSYNLALEKANNGAYIFALEPALCLCWSKFWSAWLSKAIQCPNTPWERGGYQGLKQL